MRKIVLSLIAAAMLAPVPASALAAKELAGEWDMVWANGSRNAVSFSNGQLVGAYVDDSQRACSVTASLPTPDSITLRLECPSWSASMQGAISTKGEVRGTFVSADIGNGPFRMVRHGAD